MKKIFVIISVLALAAACATTPTTPPPADANVASTPAPVALTEADAIAKEKAIWDTITTKDYVAFGDMLAADQLEVMDVAVHDKAASIADVKDFEPAELTFADWKFLPIDKDAGIIYYTVSYKGKYKGKDFPMTTVRASSAWVNRDGKWLAVFHQECTLKPAAPSTAAPAKAAASPATAAPVPATGADPAANEKIVWDLFKTKNYDGFAALLAPDFIEVEPDGVYDKAGSVKTVSLFDASKAVLSDWKTANLDADAALVVYTAKSPGGPADGERHSTIWVNRGGKWLGLFHHGGTMVMKPGAMMEMSPSPSSSPHMAPSPEMKPSAMKPAPMMSPAKKP
jgi:hypothetical protein